MATISVATGMRKGSADIGADLVLRGDVGRRHSALDGHLES